MASHVLFRIREQIRKRLYVATVHAEEEMDDDGLTVFDVESVLLTGEIIEQQRDRRSRERKYWCEGDRKALERLGLSAGLARRTNS